MRGKQCVLSTHQCTCVVSSVCCQRTVYMRGEQCVLSTHQCTCVVSSVCYQHTVHMCGKQCVPSTHQCTCVVSSVCHQHTVHMCGKQCVPSTHSVHVWYAVCAINTHLEVYLQVSVREWEAMRKVDDVVVVCCCVCEREREVSAEDGIARESRELMEVSRN